jgi:hypothetical protein
MQRGRVVMTTIVRRARALQVVLGTLLARFVHARPLRITMTARRACAGICLPAALASVLSGLCPGQSAAASRPDLRTQIERAARSPLIVLELVNGQTISGVFRGFVGDWRDTVADAARYEAWRTTRPAWVPRLGDRMIAVLASGDTISGGFMGVGPTFLALGTGNSRVGTPIEFEAITATLADSGAAIVPWSGLRGRLLDAPVFIGVALKTGSTSLVISRESIFSARGSGGPSQSNGVPVAVYVALVGVVAAALICAAAAKSTSESTSNCTKDFSELWSFCNNNTQAIDSRPIDGRFGASDVTHGVVDWAPGETRRP